MRYGALLVAGFLIAPSQSASAHPLRLSLTEIEQVSDDKRLVVRLRLFLTDVNEALVFDPDSNALAFCQPDEAPNAEDLLMTYLDQFFYLEANGKALRLQIKSKALHGQGVNTALGLVFENSLERPLTSLKIRNAVFTDLFFDQNNIIYVHANGTSKSFMLTKETPAHTLSYEATR